MSLAAGMQVTDQDTRSISSVAGGAVLGQYAQTADGRTYRYGYAGASALDPGKVMVTPAVVANHQNRAVTAAVAIGGTTVTLTLGATAATADQYAGGYLTINDVTGEGITYLVRGNLAAASSGTLTVYLQEPVTVALTTSSEGTMNVNQFSSLIVAPGAIAHQVAGVPNVTVTAAYYAWIQVGGYCSILSDGVIAKGVQGIVSDAVNGAVETRVDATTVQPVCVATEATVDTEYRVVQLILA